MSAHGSAGCPTPTCTCTHTATHALARTVANTPHTPPIPPLPFPVPRAYVKEKGLQDPKNKQYILCDDALRKLTKVNRFQGFGFQKLMAHHLEKCS